MSDEEYWGPWIEHDGAGVSFAAGMQVQIKHDVRGIAPAEWETICCRTYPGFFWRWKQVKTGWFRSVTRRVCDDPAYAPITAYRIRKPRGMVVLESLLADLPEKVDA